MAPNQRKSGKVSVIAWVPARLKTELVARAAAESITQTDAIVRALEEWLQKPPDGDNQEQLERK